MLHNHHNLPYLFFHHTSVPIQPYNHPFQHFPFHPIIKSLFSPYHPPISSHLNLHTHHIPFHPYLFPLPLPPLPTFKQPAHP
ncbi:1,3-beta-galactosyl-N-acetylhexosamine phosphorylase N-terminal domain-containing protein, partial [Paenibacillus xylanexedens]|uniref:1,3-beta-galactosyl-N-acetylhexosamine phosphorylase N-terminal domain-containing protein n=1 Tax=Paenibacillus xylanexedens TaxID=528191 RepID=UPI0034D95413